MNTGTGERSRSKEDVYSREKKPEGNAPRLQQKSQFEEDGLNNEERESSNMAFKGIGRKSPKKLKERLKVKTFKSKVLKTDNFDQILSRENNDLEYKEDANSNEMAITKSQKKKAESVKPRKSSPIKKSLENRWLKEENEKLRHENLKLQDMCTKLTSMVKVIAAKKPPTPVAKRLPKAASKEKSEKGKPSSDHLTLKLANRPPSEAKEKSGLAESRQLPSPSKTTAKQSFSNNEIHLTKDGVKVIDFRPDEEEQCMMNSELKDYERENKHRYIPRNLSHKNVVLQNKIDRDIEDCLELARTRLLQRTAQITNDKWQFKSHIKPDSPQIQTQKIGEPQGWVFDWVLYKNGRHGVSTKNYYTHH